MRSAHAHVAAQVFDPEVDLHLKGTQHTTTAWPLNPYCPDDLRQLTIRVAFY